MNSSDCLADRPSLTAANDVPTAVASNLSGRDPSAPSTWTAGVHLDQAVHAMVVAEPTARRAQLRFDHVHRARPGSGSWTWVPRNPERSAVDVLPTRNRTLVEVRTEGADGEGECGRSGIEEPTRLVSEHQRRVIVNHSFRAGMLGQRVVADADDNNETESAGEVIDGGGEHRGSWWAVGAPGVAEGEVDNPRSSVSGAAKRIKESCLPQQFIAEKKSIVQYANTQQSTGGSQWCLRAKHGLQRSMQREASDERAVPVRARMTAGCAGDPPRRWRSCCGRSG